MHMPLVDAIKINADRCCFNAASDSMNSPGCAVAARQPFMPDDHSEVVPLLPIPNRTVKRLCADDSADSRVKVGHRQATNSQTYPRPLLESGGLFSKV